MQIRECCGYRPIISSYWKQLAEGMDGKFWYLTCPKCLLTINEKKSEAEAIEAWNNKEVW